MLTALLTVVSLITMIGMFWQADEIEDLIDDSTGPDGQVRLTAEQRRLEEIRQKQGQNIELSGEEQQILEAANEANGKEDAAEVSRAKVSLQDKQAFLLTYMRELIEPAQAASDPSTPEGLLNSFLAGGDERMSKHLRIIGNQDADTLINNLTSNSNVMKFLELAPYQYSQLVPNIKLYKVFVNGGTQSEALFNFKNVTDFSRLQQQQGLLGDDHPVSYMGDGAGIKSVTYKMEGRSRNPFSKNIVDVEVKLFFQDVKTLFEKETVFVGMHPKDISYSDLIRHSAAAGPSKHRIKLTLGWNYNPTDAGQNFDLPDETIKEILGLEVSVVADLREHNLDFREDGSVELTVKYMGALENVFGGPLANILSNISNSQEGLATAEAALTKAMQQYESLQSGAPAELALRGAVDEAIQAGRRMTQYMAGLNDAQKWLIEDATGGRRSGDAGGATSFSAYGDNFVGGADPRAAAYRFRRANQEVTQQLTTEYEQLVTDYNKAMEEAQKVQTLLGVGTADVDGNKGVLWGTGGETRSGYAEPIVTEERHNRGSIQYQIENRGRTLDYIQAWADGSWDGEGTIEDNLNDRREHLERRMEEAKARVDGVKRRSIMQGALSFMLEMSEKNKLYSTADSGQLKEFQSVLSRFKARGAPNDIPPALLTEINELREEIEVNRTNPDGTSEAGLASATTRLSNLQDRINAGASNTALATSVKAGTLAQADWNSEERIVYFFLGDLLSTILGTDGAEAIGAQINNELPDFRLLLGPMEITNPLLRAGQNTQGGVSLYMLPIEMGLFQNFLIDKIVGEGKQEWQFITFLEELITYVMNFVLPSVGSGNNDVKLDLIPLNASKNLFTQDGYLAAARLNESANETLQRQPIGRTAQTLFIYAKKQYVHNTGNIPPASRRGNFEVDREANIYHFVVGGPQKGILKSLKFTNQRSSLFDVALYRNSQNGGSQGAGSIVPGKFSVKLRLIGTPFFYLGQTIFINTRLVDGGYFAKESLYFGGYYVITAVDNYFGPDKWETSIDAVLNIPDYSARRDVFIAGHIDPVAMLPRHIRARLEENGMLETAKTVLTGMAGQTPEQRQRAISQIETASQFFDQGGAGANLGLSLIGGYDRFSEPSVEDNPLAAWED